jgi:flagellum-specific peptidoglycan hydrolase FlgJ
MKNRMLVLIISIVILSSCSQKEYIDEPAQIITWNGSDTLKVFMNNSDDPNPQIHNHKFNNITFKHPKFNSKVEEEYVMRFYKTAQQEHKQFGIPASIKLAQGLLESASGTSTLSKKTNNHFGIKWTSNHKGGYVVAKDDKPNDRFRKYKSAWFSYRDHSKFLMMDRYKPCRDCGKDYECWARQLKKCGYATAPHYAESLIAIIDRNKLYKYDNESKMHQ